MEMETYRFAARLQQSGLRVQRFGSVRFVVGGARCEPGPIRSVTISLEVQMAGEYGTLSRAGVRARRVSRYIVIVISIKCTVLILSNPGVSYDAGRVLS